MLRIRLILWYSLLVVLTVTAIGVVQVVIINRSMVAGLDSSLAEDARVTLNLVSSLPESSNVEEILRHGRIHSSGSLRDLVDRVLAESPDTVTGAALTDRVISHLIDEILSELSYADSGGVSLDPLDAIAQRNISSKRNNFVEIHARSTPTSRIGTGPVMFRTPNLGRDTLSKLFVHDPARRYDTTVVVQKIVFQNEEFDVARASNSRFVVYVAFPTTEIDDAVAKFYSSFLYLLPVALLISALGGLWFARKALRPISEIAARAREIGAKNLSNRIELPGRLDRELRELTTTLNSMFARLESSFAQVTRFTSDASHELKTPLSIFKGEIEQAKRHLEQSEALQPGEAAKLLESLMEEVERMERIVEGLLLLSRADDHKLPLDRHPLAIYEFLQSLAEDGEILAESRALELIRNFDVSTKRIMVLVDSTFLYQVIMNLLDNALKYTHVGTVTMFLRKDGERVAFGVSDSGIGIAPQDLPRVFERFYRADAARAGGQDGHRSLGLGLAIVRSIVEAHEGSIDVTSEVGRGTTFTIRLAQYYPAITQSSRNE